MNCFKPFCVGAIVLLLVAQAFGQSAVELRLQGIRAMRAGNTATAIERYEAAVKLGDTPAMYNLAIIYEQGAGVPPDIGRAKDLLRRAAVAGETVAQVYLAQILRRNADAKDDQVEALKWLTEAANRGREEAQSQLAEMYRSGKGVPKDANEAKKWYVAAAVQGSPYAHVSLGLMYSWKEFGERDGDQAYRYLRGAAMLGATVGIVGVDSFEREKRFAINGECIFLQLAVDTPECRTQSVGFLRRKLTNLENGTLKQLKGDARQQFLKEREDWVRIVTGNCGLKSAVDIGNPDHSLETRKCIGTGLADWLGARYAAARPDFAGASGNGEGKSTEEAAQAKVEAEIAVALFDQINNDSWIELKKVNSPLARQTGKYYFEVVVNSERFAKSKTTEADLFVGVANSAGSYGKIIKIRPLARGRAESVIGFAADLDAKKHYRHVDGAWVEKTPQQNDGFDFSGARGPFTATLFRDSSLADLMNDYAVQVNFGNRPFRHTPPAGYVGFERPGSYLPEHRLP